MTPTQTGRESAAERKEREQEEVSAAQLANTALVGRIRPQGMSVRIEDGEVPDPKEGVRAGKIMCLGIGMPSALLDLEFPLEHAPALAASIFQAWKDHQADEPDAPKVIEAGPDDVQKAAQAAAAAERLRTGEKHG